MFVHDKKRFLQNNFLQFSKPPAPSCGRPRSSAARPVCRGTGAPRTACTNRNPRSVCEVLV